MTQNTVSPAQYRAAHNAATRINGAIASLQRIDSQTLNQDADAITRLTEFTQFLTDIYERNKATIARGDEQFERRPIELINKAASRLNQIPRDIELEQKTFAARVDTRRQKVEELGKKFSDAEIERIIPPISQDEINASRSRIEALKTEKATIEAFLADSPRYDITLLSNTGLMEV